MVNAAVFATVLYSEVKYAAKAGLLSDCPLVPSAFATQTDIENNIDKNRRNDTIFFISLSSLMSK